MGATPPTERHADTGFAVRDTPPEINRMVFARVAMTEGERRYGEALPVGCPV